MAIFYVLLMMDGCSGKGSNKCIWCDVSNVSAISYQPSCQVKSFWNRHNYIDKHYLHSIRDPYHSIPGLYSNHNLTRYFFNLIHDSSLNPVVSIRSKSSLRYILDYDSCLIYPRTSAQAYIASKTSPSNLNFQSEFLFRHLNPFGDQLRISVRSVVNSRISIHHRFSRTNR